MKKLVAITMAVVFLLVLAACGGKSTSGEKDERVLLAIEEIKAHWSAAYAKQELGDGYLEIKSARVVTIKTLDAGKLGDTYETAARMFGDVEYLVEFTLFSDYFGAAPYYTNVMLDDTVAVYRDGSAEVMRANLFSLYRSMTYQTDFSPIIADIEDFATDYNGVLELG